LAAIEQAMQHGTARLKSFHRCFGLCPGDAVNRTGVQSDIAQPDLHAANLVCGETSWRNDWSRGDGRRFTFAHHRCRFELGDSADFNPGLILRLWTVNEGAS
jgi:hypothetical protein